jgi:hypothetical protein
VIGWQAGLGHKVAPIPWQQVARLSH